MNNNQQITQFTIHGSSGLKVPVNQWIDWVLAHQNKIGYTQENGYGLGKITYHSWYLGDDFIQMPAESWPFYCRLLPDASGFICFEKDYKPNNCLLLDAYGKERMRLTVPWQMTGATRAEAGLAPTSFDNVSEPYTHPATSEVGKFGVTAHIGNGIDSKFYFELDWITGQFLWCRQIRD